MLKITKSLNPFLRRWGHGYIIESKEPIAVEEGKKTGGPKNEGSSGYVHDNKASEKRHFSLPGNVHENKRLNRCRCRFPEMLMQRKELTA